MSDHHAVRVLIVDDSATARIALRTALDGDNDIQVIGDASDGVMALDRVARLQPDLVTMDVYMKGKDGLAVTQEIMETRATPILVVTGDNPKSPALLYRAMQAGALDVCAKLPVVVSPDYPVRRRELRRLIKTLAAIPVAQRPRPTPGHTANASRAMEPAGSRFVGRPALLVVGASTGGPPLLCELLKALPADFLLPVAIVQHMARGFVVSFSEWLRAATQRKVVIATTPKLLEARTVYLAPDDRHLEVAGPDRLAPGAGPSLHYHRPSVDVLFASAAELLGPRAIAVLMSGMGRDGAQGLEMLFKAGATTFVQEPSTCIVDSMPLAAIRLGAASYVLPPSCLPSALAWEAARIPRHSR